MIKKEIIQQQLKFCLDATDFEFLGSKYVGKVRDCYQLRGGELALITTDRLSCFDRVVTLVPFKGQVLNTLALFWFDQVKDIVPTHIISSPDPNVMLVKSANPLPVEVVVRQYLTGSAWRDYQSGKDLSGIKLASGMKKDQRFDLPIVTPSTKAKTGEHDLPISEEEIINRGLVPKKTWEQAKEYAFALFARGQKIANHNGLILVDTKYEFGFCDNVLTLIDEVHTLDSSRYWDKSEYEQRFKDGVEQIMLDKEPVRQWLLSQGFKGDGPIPHFSDDYRISLAEHYIKAFTLISGKDIRLTSENVYQRIKNNLSPRQ